MLSESYSMCGPRDFFYFLVVNEIQWYENKKKKKKKVQLELHIINLMSFFKASRRIFYWPKYVPQKSSLVNGLLSAPGGLPWSWRARSLGSVYRRAGSSCAAWQSCWCPDRGPTAAGQPSLWVILHQQTHPLVLFSASQGLVWVQLCVHVCVHRHSAHCDVRKVNQTGCCCYDNK